MERVCIEVQEWIDEAIRIMNEECNINLIFTGTCASAVNVHSNPFTHTCNAEGFSRD